MTERGDATNRLVIRGGRVIDPSQSIDRIADVFIAEGLIERIGAAIGDCGFAATGALPTPQSAIRNPQSEIDAGGLIVCPGLIDMHVHLREPGGEHKETIASGGAAAAAGGFTAVACMPNTTPAIDDVETLRRVREAAARTLHCRVHPIATITKGRRGAELVDMVALKRGGAVAFSDDGDGVEDDSVMRAAFSLAKKIDALIIQHCEFKSMSTGGVMHKGAVSQRVGLAGIDPSAEEAMIERDLGLVRATGGRYHVAHISTARAVEMVRQAKREGLPVTAEVCVHHLILTDKACGEQDPNTKMHPPLRSEEDVEACVAGLCDGTIDCVATDHAPHSEEEKGVGFRDAPFGIVGLETALSLCVTKLVEAGRLSWMELLGRMSSNPALVLGVRGGTLTPGSPGDITLIDPKVRWRIDRRRFRSKSANSPFDGWEVVGRAAATLIGGRVAYSHEDYRARLSQRSENLHNCRAKRDLR